MYTDNDLSILTAAGFTEVDADWFVNEARGYALAAPNQAYVAEGSRSPLWHLFKAVPLTDGGVGYDELPHGYQSVMHALGQMPVNVGSTLFAISVDGVWKMTVSAFSIQMNDDHKSDSGLSLHIWARYANGGDVWSVGGREGTMYRRMMF